MTQISFDTEDLPDSTRAYRVVFTAASGYNLEGSGPTHEVYVVGGHNEPHEPFLQWLADLVESTPDVVSVDVYRRAVSETSI